MLPVLTYTEPDVARRRAALAQRRSQAVEHAPFSSGCVGAAFPWRTIRGEECSGYWPAGTAAFHVNADISDAVVRYVDATGDVEFEREVGLPILVETARLWRALGHHDADGRFRIDGVTGPDEYNALVDNNIYTNLMAEQNLRAAADVAARHPDRADELGVTPEEAAVVARRRHAMLIPFDERLGVHPQSEGYTEHASWDFAATRPEQYPCCCTSRTSTCTASRWSSRPISCWRCTSAATRSPPSRRRATSPTTRRSPSATRRCPRAPGGDRRRGGPARARHDYLGETALMDLDDLNHNTADGLHLASLAWTWTAVGGRVSGACAAGGRLAFSPRLPSALTRLPFRVRYRGRRIGVTADGEIGDVPALRGSPAHAEPPRRGVRGRREAGDPPDTHTSRPSRRRPNRPDASRTGGRSSSPIDRRPIVCSGSAPHGSHVPCHGCPTTSTRTRRRSSDRRSSPTRRTTSGCSACSASS